jgi:tRNA(fMet)-specific endonuclease VapC
MRYLLDTNAVVGILRGRHQGLATRALSVPRAEVCTCTIVKAELFYGSARSARPKENRAAQEAFLRGRPCFDFDNAAADEYARLRALLETAGTPIGTMDLLIAAIALANDLVLVTHNTREFSRVPGLRVEDWEA